MSGLASKQQSLKIFEKLKTKPANKVRAVKCNALWVIEGSLSPLRPTRIFYFIPPLMLTSLANADLFRLWTEEPDMDIRTSGHLPLP